MKRGDREAAAAFVTRYGSRIRRRIRGKLGPAMRRLFDSQEILSTVGRRLDLYVRNGRLEADGEDQLWSLVFKMADNALMDKLRVFQRLEEVESTEGDFAHTLLHRLREADESRSNGAEDLVDRAMRLLDDPVDREIMSMWLAGHRQMDIGDLLGMTQPAVSKRWQAIKGKLRTHFESDAE